MTNFENKKDECMKILADNMALVDGKPVLCEGTNCYNCDFYEKDIEIGCDEQAMDWLLSEYQEPVPKLTKRERAFLDSIFKEEGYKVSRGCFGLCMVFGEKNVICARLNQDMFPFIKRGETWTFEELMKLEVEK